MKQAEIKITRETPTYAHGECTKPVTGRPAHFPQTCNNTVKFADLGSEGICPACGTIYDCENQPDVVAKEIYIYKGTVKL